VLANALPLLQASRISLSEMAVELVCEFDALFGNWTEFARKVQMDVLLLFTSKVGPGYRCRRYNCKLLVALSEKHSQQYFIRTPQLAFYVLSIGSVTSQFIKPE